MGFPKSVSDGIRHGSTRSKRGNLGPCPRPWRGVVTDPPTHRYLPRLRDYATNEDDTGTGRGGEEGKRTGAGDVKTAGRMAGPSGAGERGVTTNISSR